MLGGSEAPGAQPTAFHSRQHTMPLRWQQRRPLSLAGAWTGEMQGTRECKLEESDRVGVRRGKACCCCYS